MTISKKRKEDIINKMSLIIYWRFIHNDYTYFAILRLSNLDFDFVIR